MAPACGSADDASMSKTATSRRAHAARTASRMAALALDRARAETKGEWLVLIGDESLSADADPCLDFLRELWPEVEADPGASARRPH